jgi:cytochrome c oxidase subunit II
MHSGADLMRKVAALSVSLVLAGCVPAGTGTGSSSSITPTLEQGGFSSFSTTPSSSSAVAPTVSSAPAAMSSSAQSSLSVVTKPLQIAISASNWQFNPSVVTVKKGEKVQLVVTGIEGAHGFAIPELRINERIESGQTVIIDLPTDTTGTFTFVCSIPCGAGHKEMKGLIVIE